MSNRVVEILFIAMAFSLFALFSFSALPAMAATNATTNMTVYITNTPPGFSNVTGFNQSVVVTPDPAIPSDTMTVKANISDDNGDSLTVNATYYNTTGGAQGSVVLVYNSTSGLWENNTFALSPTAEPGTWSVTVFASDGLVTTNASANFTVQTLVALALANSPIDFGNTTAGVANRRADNGTAGSGYTGGTIKGFPLLVNNTGNVNQNYTIVGTNMSGLSNPSYNIPVGDVAYNTVNNVTASTALSGAETQYSSTNAPTSIVNTYFWIDTPLSIPQQRYTGNVTIRAYQS